MQIFVDFDGTVTSRDSIVYLTETFGGGAEFRLDAFRRIESGEWTVYEAIERELASVRVSWSEAARRLKQDIQLDPYFPAFARWCRRRAIPLAVVSSGIEQVLELFLGDLELPLFAHRVEMRQEGWRYHRRFEHDKERILGQANGNRSIVYVGDGTSDVAAIPYADRLYAKKYLARYCLRKNIPFIAFETFQDVQADLAIRQL